MSDEQSIPVFRRLFMHDCGGVWLFHQGQARFPSAIRRFAPLLQVQLWANEGFVRLFRVEGVVWMVVYRCSPCPDDMRKRGLSNHFVKQNPDTLVFHAHC